MNPHFLQQPPLWFGLIVALLFAGAARSLRLLSKSGAISAAIVGFTVYGMGGGRFLIALLVFFLSSSLLSKVGGERKQTANRQDEKGSARDAAQVWANGGAATACVVVFYVMTHNRLFHLGMWSPLKLRYLLMLYLAALASVNADTWSTEIGKLSATAPRLLTNWKPTTAGVSGAVSGAGMFGAFAGALVIPLVMLPLWRMNMAEVISVAWAGFLASVMDSVLGATLQVQYRDPMTGELTEKPSVRGERMAKVRGVSWLNNDGVNFAASLCGVLMAWVLLAYGVYKFY